MTPYIGVPAFYAKKTTIYAKKQQFMQMPCETKKIVIYSSHSEEQDHVLRKRRTTI